MIKLLFISAFAVCLHGYGENYEELTEKVRTMEWEHFQYLNELRAKGFKCPLGHVYEPNSEPLVFDCRLWKTAQAYSKQMGADDHFEHEGKDGSTFVSRARANGIYSSGENLSGGYLKPYNTLMSFLYSDGHCMNLGRTSFKLFGGGFFTTPGSKYEYYFTQMYAPESEKPADTSCYPDDITPTIAPTPAFQGMWGGDGEGPIRKGSDVVRNGDWDPVQCKIVRDGDVKCSHCMTTAQCQEAYDGEWFCCPYLKKCIKSHSWGGFDGCGGPPADCIGNCDENDPFGCTCYNQDFPRNWMKGCQDPTLTPAPTREDGQIYNEHKCWKKTTDDMVCVDERPVSIQAMTLPKCLNNYYNYQCEYVKFRDNWCFCILGDGVRKGCETWLKYDKSKREQTAAVYVNRHSQYFKPDDSGDCVETDNGDPQVVEVYPPIVDYTANPTVQPVETPEESGVWNPLTCHTWGRANCEPCFTDDQCRWAFRRGETGSKWMCHPKKKMCVLKMDPEMWCPGSTLHADCDGSCDQTMDPAKCNCGNTRFPRQWIRGCHDPTLEEEITYNEDGWIVSENQCWEEWKDMKCTGGTYAFSGNNFELKDCVNKFHNNQCTSIIFSEYGGCQCKVNCMWRRFQDTDYNRMSVQRKYYRKCTPKDPEGLPIVLNARAEVWIDRGVGSCGYVKGSNQWSTWYTVPKTLRKYSRIRSCKYECEINEKCTHYATDVDTDEEEFGKRGLSCWLWDEKEKGMMVATNRPKNMRCYVRESSFQQELLLGANEEKTAVAGRSEPQGMVQPPQKPVSGTLGGAINDWKTILFGCAMFAFVLGGILSFLKANKGNNVEVDEARMLLAA